MYFSRLLMEITNVCNGSCVFCPNPTQKRKKDFMEFDLFKKIIDDLYMNHTTGMIHFNMMGEAMLHKDFFKMVDYVKSRTEYPVELVVLSNGFLLKNEALQDQILNSKIDTFGVSVRARDDYEYRFKLNRIYDGSHPYEKYIQSLKNFVRKAHERNAKLLISFNYFHTVYSCYSIIPSRPYITKKSQAQDLAEFWHEPIKDFKEAIPLNKIYIPFSSQIGCTFGNVIHLSNKFQLRLNKMMLWHNKLLPEEYFIKEAGTRGCCDQPKGELIVMYNGDVAGCGNDFECDINLGNLGTSTIDEVVSTEKYINFTTNIKKGTLTMPICKICQGKITRKDTGQEQSFKLPTAKKYFYLFLDDPRKCIKKIKTKIKARMKK